MNEQVVIYPRTVTETTLLEELTDRVKGLRYSTRVHGGFYQCRFTLPGDRALGWRWLAERIGCRLVVYDNQDVLWEGRIEDVTPDFLNGRLQVLAEGYYNNLADKPYSTAYNDHFDVVIKAVLTANCAQISGDQSHIAATNITIDSGGGASYLDITAQQIVEKLSQFSDSTSGKWYFAIWENRIPYLTKRAITAIDWQASIEAGDFRNFQITHRLKDLWNSCYAVYQAGGSLTRTAVANNTDSQTKYGLTRQYTVPDLGAVAQAAAEAYRDAVVANNKDIWPRQCNIVLGDRVQDGQATYKSSNRVRAGDVFSVSDLVPVSGNLTTLARDAIQTLFLVETEYDADAGEMHIYPEFNPIRLESLLVRKPL